MHWLAPPSSICLRMAFSKGSAAFRQTNSFLRHAIFLVRSYKMRYAAHNRSQVRSIPPRCPFENYPIRPPNVHPIDGSASNVALHLPAPAGLHLGRDRRRVDLREEGGLQGLHVPQRVLSQVAEDAAGTSLVLVDGAVLGAGASQHPAELGPDAGLGPVDLVDAPRVPHQHVPGADREGEPLVHVLLQSLGVDIHEDGHVIDHLVVVGALEVHGRSVVLRRVVHGDPKADAVLEVDRPVLVVLVPLEAAVGVDHEQIGGDANGLRPAQLRQDAAHGAVVEEAGEAHVGLPHVALDVVVELGRRAGEAPDMRVLHLVHGASPEVLQPLRAQHARNVDHAVPLERLDHRVRHGEKLRRIRGRNALGQRNLGVLEPHAVVKEVVVANDASGAVAGSRARLLGAAAAADGFASDIRHKPA
eukprot:scaffold1954_cov268-Pinguiococcus_pyrenoidosus.AAC.232